MFFQGASLELAFFLQSFCPFGFCGQFPPQLRWDQGKKETLQSLLAGKHCDM